MKFSCYCLYCLLNSALECHWIGTCSNVTKTFTHKCLSENGCGRSSIASDIICLLGNFLDELGTDFLVWIFEFDFLSDRNTVVGDRGGSPLLLQHNVASARSESDLHCVCELVHSTLETTTRLFIKGDDLGHSCSFVRGRFHDHDWVAPATDDLVGGLAPQSGWVITLTPRVLPIDWHSPTRSANCERL
ncbi:unannotated protein [freshwater metagenome]|uniref:Unannotated protein n=1 Tax=freshwater metagenome TaxID=449393 RepID=A0A6J7SMP3_9ZZZZ